MNPGRSSLYLKKQNLVDVILRKSWIEFCTSWISLLKYTERRGGYRPGVTNINNGVCIWKYSPSLRLNATFHEYFQTFTFDFLLRITTNPTRCKRQTFISTKKEIIPLIHSVNFVWKDTQSRLATKATSRTNNPRIKTMINFQKNLLYQVFGVLVVIYRI